MATTHRPQHRAEPRAAAHAATATCCTQRAVDTRGFQLNRQGKIGIAMGSEGHEAVQAGTGLAFERGKDLLYPYYRNTGLILACGFPLADLFRSQLARAERHAPAAVRSSTTSPRARWASRRSRRSSPRSARTRSARRGPQAQRRGGPRRVLPVRRRRDLARRVARGAQLRRRPRAAGAVPVREQPVGDLDADQQADARARASRRARAGYGMRGVTLRRLRSGRRLHDRARRARARGRRQRPGAGRVDVLPLPLAHDRRRRPHLSHARRGRRAPSRRSGAEIRALPRSSTACDRRGRRQGAQARDRRRWSTARPTRSKPSPIRTPRRYTATPTPAPTTPG